MIFKDKILLITGGTGSFGNAVVEKLINSDLKEIRVLSRDACSKLISLDSSSMANGTEIAYRLLSGNIKIKEFPCTILYNYDEKKSQSPLASLNIISDLLQKK